LVGVAAARSALRYVAPVGEKEQYVDRAINNVTPYLPGIEADPRLTSDTLANT
jgi:hypothetical protein